MYKNARFAERLASYTPSEEIVLLVNTDNERIGGTTRREMRLNRLTHRSTFIFILNPEGKLFVQKRTTTKDVFPGFYDASPGGVILEDDPSDEISARRELQEEMGISPETLEFCFYHFYEDERISVWCSVFLTHWDGELILQPEEVQWVELMSPEEIFSRSNNENFCTDSLEILKRMCETGKIMAQAPFSN